MDTERSKELWDRLENEPRRAFEAFQTFLSLPSVERTLVEAYRRHVDNPQATKVSDTWARWSRDFAWRERAAAHDEHLDRIRERGIEKAIEAEAEMQARAAEKTRYRYNELMTLGYERAAQWLENAQPSDLRGPDVMRIIGLHLDYLKAFGVEEPRAAEDDWTEEDEARMTDIIKKVDELEETQDENPEEGSGEEDSESDHPDETR